MTRKKKRPAKRAAKKSPAKATGSAPRRRKAVTPELRDKLLDQGEALEENYEKDRAVIVDDLLRWKLVQGPRADLLYAVRVLVDRHMLAEMTLTSAWIEELADRIGTQFDFRSKRKPLDDPGLQRAVEVLSAAVDAHANRRVNE